MKIGFGFLFLLLLSTATLRAQLPEQTFFSAEDATVQNPVAVPEPVLALLRDDDQVKSVLDYARLAPEDLPQFWFSASVIHLADRDEQDLLVMGKEMLAAANVATFWIFRPHQHGYELVLAAPAHQLTIRPQPAQGLRAIELQSGSAGKIHTALFLFNGQQYKLAHEEGHPVP